MGGLMLIIKPLSVVLDAWYFPFLHYEPWASEHKNSDQQQFCNIHGHKHILFPNFPRGYPFLFQGFNCCHPHPFLFQRIFPPTWVLKIWRDSACASTLIRSWHFGLFLKHQGDAPAFAAAIFRYALVPASVGPWKFDGFLHGTTWKSHH